MCSKILMVLTVSASGVLAFGQKPPAVPIPRPAESSVGSESAYTVEPGTRIPLSLINSISTKNAAPGDRVYLQTAFPILDRGHIVIPVGSYVEGTVTQAKRPGRVKGRGELYIRFNSLTLPNGVTRDFRATLSQLDGMASEELNRGEGKIKSSGDKGGDARTIGQTAAAGASVGSIAGAVAGRPGMGVGLGAAAGAAAGLVGVLLSRGPDAILERGSTVEMVLDRRLSFSDTDLDYSKAPPQAAVSNTPPAPRSKSPSNPISRWPF
jgi:type IV secretion system protein VirB10